MSHRTRSSAAIAPWSATSRAEITRRAQRWLASPALAELTAGLGGLNPSPLDARALLDWSAANLDTRKGAERRDARAAEWDAGWIELLLAVAAPLGLIETAPPGLRAYDTGLILGGATTGNRLRTEFAAHLVQSGVTFAELVGLTAVRPLGPDERAGEPDSADDESEWQNLSRYLHERFGPLRSCVITDGGKGTLTWREETLTNARDEQRLRLLVAPSSTTQRRATTSDAIRFFLDRTPPDQRVSTLVITSSIYAPYQFFSVAPILLDAGVEHVELVGTPTRQDRSTLLAQRVGQEIHAAIEAATSLITAQ